MLWRDQNLHKRSHDGNTRVKHDDFKATNVSMAIYKHDRGVEPGSTEKQLQLSGQSGTRTRDLRISSPPRCLRMYAVLQPSTEKNAIDRFTLQLYL